ncbi:MAG: phosphate signaling complex protein PhoU [Planctomycetota bacterium]
MSKHLETEMARLKKAILGLAAVVERSVGRAVQALEKRDARLAQELIDADAEIDHTEVDIEEECLKILALHQPVAVDLRLIVAVLKINNDLERVGDLGVNIAERALHICNQPPIELAFDFAGMHHTALGMLGRSLDALMKLDAELARSVRSQDDEVDEMNRRMYAVFGQAVRANPDKVEVLLSYLSTVRHLERIADYATNIAEDVIYLVEGQIVRHQPSPPSQ